MAMALKSLSAKSLLSILLLIFHQVQNFVHAESRSKLQTRALLNKVVIGVDGGTESIRACCFDAENGKQVGKSCAVPYKTHHPKPGWAEQDPKDWYQNLCEAVRTALDSVVENGEAADVEMVRSKVCAICVDTTCCSVVALDDRYEPLRPSLLWMDARSAQQTSEILSKCRGDPALDVNCGGEGPISAEWMTPKCLWIKQNEPELWEKAATICEYQDYINYRLTGIMCASSCNAAARWHWNGEECIKSPLENGIIEDGDKEHEQDSAYPGRPMSLYKTLGIPELAKKLPKKCLPMGSLIGNLSDEAAEHLNLPKNLPVAQGGPDAFVGMIGLGCIHPGQLCLITGSSHLHCVVTSKPTTNSGSWGAYQGAPLPGINFAEGGQSSTGSIIRWAKSLFGKDLDYKTLDDEASTIAPGSDGLVALETYQGSRTPITDPLARGALVGLTLSHKRGHIWRALMEAVCYGTRACVEGLAKAGHECDEIIIAGGTTRSSIWLQMHADVTGKPVVLCENIDAPLLGCAILASVGAGIYNSVEDAVNAMVRTARRVEPQTSVAKEYKQLYSEVYTKLSPAVMPVVHSIANLRGGHVERVKMARQKSTASKLIERGDRFKTLRPSGSYPKFVSFIDYPAIRLRGGYSNKVNTTADENAEIRKSIIVSPSLLASDWANISSEIKRCVDANLSQLHIDVFDGVFLDSPYALTFGPQMVRAMRSVSKDIILDIHLCVDRPERYVKAMAESGASRIIFQWEAMGRTNIGGRGQLNDALFLAKSVIDHDLKCGISINPETDVTELFPLLESGLFDIVDVLAVEPGFGGQVFQSSILKKVGLLHRWILENGMAKEIGIMVDGGINKETGQLVRKVGANVLVAGTFLFRHPKSLKDGVKDLLVE